ncbi:MAG TPA: TRAP transporter small permease subunit [Burkholderiales bacterium]|nr:TRAP transporter small permease subunit [Burkholderiales bacterium]
MDSFVRSIGLISRACGYFAAALIAVGVVVVCEMVFVRFVLNENTIWQTDFVTYSLVAATFIGSPFVLLTRGHVNVDVLPHYLGERARFRLALAAALMALAFCIVMLALTTQYWLQAWNERWLSNTMWRVRLWIPYASMPIGLGILTLQYVVDLYNLVTGREPPFGIGEERTH